MIDFAYYVKQGFIKEERPNFRQIENQLHRASKDLKTFYLVIKKDPEWASTMAYQAILRAGRALMYAHGFLPIDGQQHKTVVEITGKILGSKYDTLVNQFNRLRKKRNIFFYDSTDSHNYTEAKMAANVAHKLLYEIDQKIKKLDPQQRIKN